MITITDEEIKELIDKKINKIIENDYEKIIRETLSEAICKIFDFRKDTFLYDVIELVLNEELKRHIEEEFKRKDYFSDERLKEIEKRVADNIAYKLRTEIINSISYKLCDKEDDEED